MLLLVASDLIQELLGHQVDRTLDTLRGLFGAIEMARGPDHDFDPIFPLLVLVDFDFDF